jgi:hypothetical protein
MAEPIVETRIVWANIPHHPRVTLNMKNSVDNVIAFPGNRHHSREKNGSFLLNEILEEAIYCTQYRAIFARILVEVEPLGETWVEGNAAEVRQMLCHSLINAMGQTAPEGTVTIALTQRSPIKFQRSIKITAERLHHDLNQLCPTSDALPQENIALLEGAIAQEIISMQPKTTVVTVQFGQSRILMEFFTASR